MWWMVRMLYELVSYSLLDFVFFVIVDGVAKSPLKEARSEDEKKMIWFYESVVLSALCLLIYTMDHCPYVLIALTLATAVYTQLCRQADFRNLWHRFKEHWEVHVHHADNVKAINEKRKQIEIWRKLSMQWQAPVSKPVMSRLSDFICRRNEKKAQPQTVAAPVYSMMKMFKNSPTTTGTTPNTQPTQSSPVVQQPSQAFPQPVQSFSQPVPVRPQQSLAFSQPAQGFTQSNQAYSQPRQMSPPPNQNFSSSQPFHQMPSTRQFSQTPVKPANNWFTRNDLRRRPLRNYEQRELPQIPFSSSRSSIRDKFMSAFGYSSVDKNKPAGLRNEGQNLCFLNCVIQCLAHTPNLVDKLIHDAEQELDCSETESVMIDALISLMSQCKKTKQDGQNSGVLDATVLREAISLLPNRLVAPPTERQNQQDAAEFFMWLMETLHNSLNKKITKEKRPKGSNLDTLEFIYKDLSEERMQGLKTACREEINQANGLQNETYAEPIQRLSDLEWLTYKQRNHSVIDDMFSGQLVEAYQCLAGNHLTVNMQTFNILPVPIETINNYSGVVPLEECFTRFCNIEHLVGPEGLECEMCKKNFIGHSGIQTRGRKSGPRTPQLNSHIGSIDSAFQSGVLSSTAMSPIAGQTDVFNDSGFQDNVFRTSTPVGERARFIFPSRQVQETERRCLLRQLPDCLVIQPLRFSYNQFTQQSRKIHTPISIPLKGLDLTNIVYDNVTNREDLTAGHMVQKYDLYAVCSHLGAESTSYGHYVCYCLAKNGVWYKFDDELVTEVNMEYEITSKEIRQNAYMLFYKRATEIPV
ncbi:uncharacterized protein LOC123530097 [Mercenaria mercenaria]|uniref:uncharacterized protein LOC123530097 n=1 Tax=Mercenaria mercenaria TaxID=6596 RepID=UPI00234E3C48|nr:uncharacterized protein LOC123530097 [Mercenaria mercenaria]